MIQKDKRVYIKSINYLICIIILILTNCSLTPDGINYPPENQIVTPPPVAGPIVTDIDGNEYHSITLGNQIWTIENLRTGRYNNGDTIPFITDCSTWKYLATPGYCYYKNTTDTAYNHKYGALYNWYAVNTNKLAPAGWHIPSHAEWDTLINYLIANRYNWDGSTTYNLIAKSLAAASDWAANSVIGTIGNDLSKNNRSGFSALPSGYRNVNGSFMNAGIYTDFWSSSEFTSVSAYTYFLNTKGSYLGNTYDSKYYGFPVRLIKNH